MRAHLFERPVLTWPHLELVHFSAKLCDLVEITVVGGIWIAHIHDRIVSGLEVGLLKTDANRNYGVLINAVAFRRTYYCTPFMKDTLEVSRCSENVRGQGRQKNSIEDHFAGCQRPEYKETNSAINE